jgi:glutamyl-tRNA synthetase
MSQDEIVLVAKKFALQNAVQFDGAAQPKAVIGKVIGIFQKQGVSPKEIIPIVQSVVSEVNSLSLDDQRQMLEDLAPEMLEKKKKVRDFSLPNLPNAEDGKVVTRFPPEPNGYLHIGHAKAAIVDYEYAKKYGGKFILRFDDTNPENDRKEFYDAQKADLKWLGISWDEVYNTSDHLPMHYKLASQLISQGDAYVCQCSPEDIKKGRFEKKPCSCRGRDVNHQAELWNRMLDGSLSNCVLRLKADMESVNTAMRDPTLFRIIDTPHPLQGDRYHVWPTYDFAGAVEDSISGVTHPFRTKEYELRDECYFFLLEKLNLRKPHLMEFARLSIEGMPVSKRKIKPLIEQGLVQGYDDIRLPTLQGLRRRGILPEAIKQFVLTQGISKVESTVTFSLVEAENRKIIDPISKRLFFVSDPIQLTVEGSLKRTVSIPFHPTDESMGHRSVNTADTFFIPSEDAHTLQKDDIFRLKDLYNVKIVEKNEGISGLFAGTDLIQDSLKIQWTTDNYVPVTVYVPDRLFNQDDTYNKESLRTINGYAEKALDQFKTGDIIQFERFGFVRLERTSDGFIANFCHR